MAHSEKPTATPLHTLAALVDLRVLAAQRYGEGQRAGKAVLYRAPWRADDDTPSFAVYADGFKDFGGTGESGSTFDWIMREYGLTFAEARAFVQAAIGGLSMAEAQRPLRPESSSPSEPPSAEWQQAAEAALAHCQERLWSPAGTRALDYLRQVRGLTDDTIRRFGLGYNPAWRSLPYTQPETDKAIALPSGIVIPWRASGALWALRVRCRVGNFAAHLGLPDDQQRSGKPLPKYLALSGSHQSAALFNADALTAETDALLVEGEFDAMLAQQQLGDSVAVITLGSAAGRLARRWREEIAACAQVFLALDTDAAGQAATERLGAAVGEHRQLLVPQGKDISEYVITHGGDLRAWFEQATRSASELGDGYAFSAGVPDSWRSALLNYLSEGAVVYELITEALRSDLLDPQAISIPALLECSAALQYTLSAAAVRRGVETLVGVFLSELLTESQDHVVSRFDRKGAGRSARTFALLPLEEAKRALLLAAAVALYQSYHPTADSADGPAIVAALSPKAMQDTLLVATDEAQALASEVEALSQPAYAQQQGERQRAHRQAQRAYWRLIQTLTETHTTPLPPGWAIHSSKAYRVAVLRVLKLTQGEQLRTRKQIAAAIGVSVRVVNEYLAAAGVQVESGQIEERALNAGANMSRQVKSIAREVQGKPLWIVTRSERGETRHAYNEQALEQLAVPALTHGVEVVVVCQVANRHHIVDAPIVTQPPPQKSLSAAKSRPVERRSAPTAPPPKPGEYDPAWVLGQLQLRLRLMGWYLADGHFFNPYTGEIAPDEPSAHDLVVLMVGHPIRGRDNLLE